MTKTHHEVRDPIHTFVRVDTDERAIIDSRPVQRLRHIHQLATSYLVYPGATHRRFEHSLGVMELAGRVYDVVTDPNAVPPDLRDALPEVADPPKRLYWRRVVRLAALCHDLGHLPFSHAAEHQLLPEGWDHERLSRDIILSEELSSAFTSMTPPVRPDDVAKLAVGPKKAKDLTFSLWETILSEIIVGDAFGVDRIDYLLRDSHHAGVAYGRFDHNRLIDTLRILPSPPTDATTQREPALGVEAGGLLSAEALLLARYFMYSQVYFHRVRMIYDIHLIDFLKEWLSGGRFATDIETHLRMTDNEVTAAISNAARSEALPGHRWARRLAERRHFRVLYSRRLEHVERNPDAALAVDRAIGAQYGSDYVRTATKRDEGGQVDFPVLTEHGQIASSIALSQTLQRLPVIATDYVYVDEAILSDAKNWLSANEDNVIEQELETLEEE
jgi:HD superfamily phosphohydrolase